MLIRVIKLIISLGFFVLMSIRETVTGLVSVRVFGRHIVLTYHSVPDSLAGSFCNQMEMVAKYGKLAEPWPSQHRKGLNVSVTFDDGFANIARNALPCMARLGIPATIFVTTGYLGRLPGWIENGGYYSATELLLSEQQLLELAKNGVMVGSHTVTHPHLASLDNEAVLEELMRSKETLTGLLGREISLLALPYGSGNSRVLDLAEKAGYQYIFLNTPAWRADAENGGLVGRINADCRDWPIESYLKIKGAYGWLPIGMVAKRVLRNFVGMGP